jgi:hypothetical protein
LNYLTADVIALFDPAMISQLMTGHTGSLHFTPRFLLDISIFMEIPFLMVVLSRVNMRVEIAGKTVSWKVDEPIFIPRGVEHSLANQGETAVDLLSIRIP